MTRTQPQVEPTDFVMTSSLDDSSTNIPTSLFDHPDLKSSHEWSCIELFITKSSNIPGKNFNQQYFASTRYISRGESETSLSALLI